MNKREIKKAIYLTGLKPNYQVHHNMPGEAIVCHVAQADIGHDIIRTLRLRAYRLHLDPNNRALPDGWKLDGDGWLMRYVPLYVARGDAPRHGFFSGNFVKCKFAKDARAYDRRSAKKGN